jgi:hypothetical protein
MNHGKQTYMGPTAIDNYCYAEDEEIELSSTVVRQQIRKPVREPPIGASTTFKITETCADNISARTTATPVSPKRNPPKGTKIASTRSDHQNETTITPPRTPKKNVSVIVTSNPRKSSASESPRRAVTLSPRRQQTCATVPPLSSPRKAIMPTSPTRPSVRAVKYVLAHRNTAVIPPMYTSANSARISDPQKQEPFLACRKSPTGIDTSPALKASWIHMPTPYQTPPTGTIVTAGATLLLCGAVTVVLSLYMMSKVRKNPKGTGKLVVTQPLQKFFAFYETRRVVYYVHKSSSWSLYLKPIESNPSNVISLISILIISPTLRTISPSGCIFSIT